MMLNMSKGHYMQILIGAHICNMKTPSQLFNSSHFHVICYLYVFMACTFLFNTLLEVWVKLGVIK